MKHYVLLMEEKRMMKNVYSNFPYIKNEMGNSIPKFHHNGFLTIIEAIKALEEDDYKRIESLTVEEIILNDVGLVSIYFFDVEEKFVRPLFLHISNISF